MAYRMDYPATISQVDMGTGKELGKPLTFLFTVSLLVQDKRFCVDEEALGHAYNILQLVSNTKPGDLLVFADIEGWLLQQVAHQPQGMRSNNEYGYPSGVFIQAWPHINAIMQMKLVT